MVHLAVATPEFPRLVGRVVDEAALLSPQARITLSRQLEKHERATGQQVVVVTLNSLEGYAIEEYGYRLGRHWGIGEKDKNTGVLLIAAPNERRMRIEVGYGLEGVLTDARSHQIIQEVIRPAFKKGDYEQGIVQGTAAILRTLGGEQEPSRSEAPKEQESRADKLVSILLLIPFAIFIITYAIIRIRYAAYCRDHLGGHWDSGFGGGGGSFGGGGASGSW